MLEVLQYEFMRNALLAGILAAVACGIVGVYVVSKRIVFISGGIAHASFGGIGLGYLVGISPVVGAFFFALAMIPFIAFGQGLANDACKLLDQAAEESWQEYTRQGDTQWDRFEREQQEEWLKFKEEAERKWDEFVDSTNKTWVDYGKELDARSQVDFEKGTDRESGG